MSELEDHKKLLQLQSTPPKLKPSETHKREDKEEEEREEAQVSNSGNEEYCKTPTSKDNKIPTIQSCPPTPRKKAQVFSHRKRKKPDHDLVHFFEATGREEVDSFFKSTTSEMSYWVESHAVKKRCKSP